MDTHVEFSLAKEIIDTMKAILIVDQGLDPTDPAYLELLEYEAKVNLYDKEIIDKIINDFAPLIKARKQ